MSILKDSGSITTNSGSIVLNSGSIITNSGSILPASGGGAIDPVTLVPSAYWDGTLSTIVTTPGAFNIEDLGPNGLDGTQTNSSFQPALTTSELNGLDGLVFDGNDRIDVPDHTSLRITDNATIFVIARTDDGSQRTLFSKGDSASGGGGAFSLNYAWQEKLGNGDNTFIFDGTSFKGVASGSRLNYKIKHFVWDNGTQFEFFENGTSLGNQISSTTWHSTDKQFTWGSQGPSGTNSLVGGITTLLIYNKTLTIDEQNGVLQFLSDQYAIPVSTL